MNEVYIDLEEKNMINKLNELFSTISRELGIRNNNITITISCSEEDIQKFSDLLTEEAEKIGTVTMIDQVKHGGVGKIRYTSYQSPLGKLKFELNGK